MQTLIQRFGMAGVVAAGAFSAQAGTIYTSNGFESPTFTTGNLVGQDAWTSFTIAAATGTTTATVHNAVNPIQAGSQALTISRPSTEGLGSTGFFVDVSAAAAGHLPVVFVLWDMYVPASGDQDPDPSFESFGPGFAVEAYANIGGPSPARLASVGVDAADGAFYNKLDDNVSQFADYSSNAAIQLDTWQAWELILDFQNETYFVVVDGTVISTSGGTAFLNDIDYAGGDRLSDAPIIGFPTDEFYIDITGDAFFDNYRILDGNVVPEPGVALLTLAGCAALRRRNNARA